MSDINGALQAAGRFFQTGELDQAAQILEDVHRRDPENFDAALGLAIIYATRGNLDAAIPYFEKAAAIRPGDGEAHFNLGRALSEKGRSEEAILSYRRALAINPNDEGTHINLGNLLKDRGDMAGAVDCYRRAIEINPNQAIAHTNLGSALQELGQFDDAFSSHQRALALAPNAPGLWKNLAAGIRIQNHLGAQGKEEIDTGKVLDGLPPAARATPDFALLRYHLESFNPVSAGDSFDGAMAALPPKTDETISVDGPARGSSPNAGHPEKLVALFHSGRSGTGLLHSLIDGHPEISTLPSIYLKGYFNAGIWQTLAAEGWRRLPERFADLFEVLFDARSPKPVPGLLGEDNTFLGDKEGMTRVGDDRRQSLSVDKAAFCSNARQLMEGLEEVDPRSFFLIVHAAFEKTLGTASDKSLAFYHIHHGTLYTRFNFLRYFPDARLVLMAREPVENCESWIRADFQSNNYSEVVRGIHNVLFDIDSIEFQRQDSIGVRLEDLKMRHEPTLERLCAWLGVAKTPSLHEMTAQGKKWWGDPSSPDYSATEAMAPFGQSAGRPREAIFSERDRFVIATLFHPFSVRFGYAEPDPKGFEADLKAIRPVLDDLFDFEKTMAERSGIDPADFKRQGNYHLFRAGLLDRWRTLDQLGDYPGMVPPLDIDDG